MSKQSYGERLRDPRWQKRRLEVLESSEWTCQECDSKAKTFHVHHSFYERGKDPWEAKDEHLLCLCEKCHEERQAVEQRLLSEFAAALKWERTAALEMMAVAFCGMGPDVRHLMDVIRLSRRLDVPQAREEFKKAFGLCFETT